MTVAEAGLKNAEAQLKNTEAQLDTEVQLDAEGAEELGKLGFVIWGF